MIVQRIHRTMLALLLVELVSLCVAFTFCYFSFYDYISASAARLPYQPQNFMFFFISGLVISILASFTHFAVESVNLVDYANSSIINYFRTSLISLLIIWGVGMLAGFFLFSGGAAYLFFVFLLSAGIVALPLSFIVIWIVRRIYSAPINQVKVLIVGINRRSLRFAEKLRENSQLGFSVAGFLDPDPSEAVPNKDYLGGLEDAGKVLKEHKVTLVLFFLPVRSFYDSCAKIVELAGKHGVSALAAGDIFNRVAQPGIFGLHGLGNIVFTPQSQAQLGIFLRRCADLFFSILLIILTFPLGLAIGGHIYARGGSPVLLSQQVIGLNGQLFRRYKYRTHKLDPASPRPYPTEVPPEDGGRELISFGGLMRSLHLDSMPYLVNIASGDMSFFGPTPLSAEEFEKLSPEEQRRRGAKKPGLFGG